MEPVTCSVCGCQNDTKRYFCGECGALLHDSDRAAASEEELKLMRVIANLKVNPHTDILWNDTVDVYARRVERIQSLIKVKDMGIQSAELTEKVGRFLKICRNPDFEIAFVGAVKAGKSTLINALLGRNYAATDPNPETAVLTKFRSSEQDYVKVKFYAKSEWKKLWNSVQSGAERFLQLYRELKADAHREEWVGHKEEKIELENHQIEEELKKWSSSQSPVHFFVREIEVGISSLPKDFPKQVVFVDTPGLFDPVAFRSQISIDYIHKANAVLVCVKAEDLHGEEVRTVESVVSFAGEKRNKVFVIATNWDRLNDVVIDWQKRYDYMVDTFTGKAFFPNKEMARNNILYAASYHYNLCRTYQSLRNAQKNEINILLMKLQTAVENCEEQGIPVPGSIAKLKDAQVGMPLPSDLEAIMEVTNIQTVNKRIVTELVNQYADLMLGDIRNMYEDILHTVSRAAGEREKIIREWMSDSRSDLRDVERKVKQTRKNSEEIKKVQKQLTTALISVDKSTQRRLDQILSKLG